MSVHGEGCLDDAYNAPGEDATGASQAHLVLFFLVHPGFGVYRGNGSGIGPSAIASKAEVQKVWEKASPYKAKPASCESSRNGEPGSRRAAILSRGGSLFRLRWRSIAFAPPPSQALAILPCRSCNKASNAPAFS